MPPPEALFDGARVAMRGIEKRFGDTRALAGVDFAVRGGEVHALLGENGAGKSTLMHVMAGLTRPDAGHIRVDDRPIQLTSPRAAAGSGIAMVHQHFSLVENLTVRENLALVEPGGWLLPPEAADRALSLAKRLGWEFRPDDRVWQLPVGVRQRLEIVKALSIEPRILVFVEPTAVLTPAETEDLFRVLDRLRGDGVALVLITHKLAEVLAIADRITVLRRGVRIATLPRQDATADELARLMVGEGASGPGTTQEPEGSRENPAVGRCLRPRSAGFVMHPRDSGLAPSDPESPPGSVSVARRGQRHRPTTETPPGAGSAPSRRADSHVLLSVDAAVVLDDRGVPTVDGASLTVAPGEILGVAGVDGNGQAELAEAILGTRPLRSGSIRFPALCHKEGRRPVGYIPQDRLRAGLVAGMTVGENLILGLHREPEFRRGPWLRWGPLRQATGEMIARYDIRIASPEQLARTLSGGNQQKIVVARAMYPDPPLLVAVNPTRGLDLGASAFVHAQLREHRARGGGLLLVSTDLDEVQRLADRIAVLFRGQIVATVSPDTPRERLGLLMGGQAETAGAA